MKITYIGHLDEVYLPGASLTVANGQTIEVPDDLGDSLLEQEINWAKPKAIGPKAKPDTPSASGGDTPE